MSLLSFTLFTILGCRSEEGVKVYNTDPEASITSHASGTELMEAVEYTFVGQVSDGNHGMSELKVVWSTDTRALCEESVPGASGAQARMLRRRSIIPPKESLFTPIKYCFPRTKARF